MISWASVCLLAIRFGSEIGDRPGYLFGEFRVEGFYGGIMTAASAFFLGAGGTSLLVVAALFGRRSETRRLAFPWVVAGVGLFVLGADDLLMLHEILGYRLERIGVPRLLGMPHNQAFFVLYAVVTLLLLGPLLEVLRVQWRALFPLACALGLFALAGLVDLGVPLDHLTARQQAIFGPMDQVAKAIGTLMMFAFAQTLLVSVARVGDAGEGEGEEGTVTEARSAPPQGLRRREF